MLEVAGKQIADTLEEIVDPGRSALLLWDLEYAIAPNAFNYAEIAPRLKVISDHARQIGVPVFYSQQMHYDLKRDEGEVWMRVRAKRGAGGEGVKIPAGKKGHDFVEELAPQPGDVVFQKRRPDGFIGTDLDLMLRHRGIKTVLIGGVATEGGVEGTARTGRNLGYYTVILRDCVGSRSREFHESALKLMQGAYFDITTADEVGRIWMAKS
jgi:nicotinamidase-related amidase